MSSAIWILWASLVETTEPQQLFLYGAVCGVVLTALVMLPLMLLTKLTEPQRVLARAAAGRHQPIATESHERHRKGDPSTTDSRNQDEDSHDDSNGDIDSTTSETDSDSDSDSDSDDNESLYCKMVLLVRTDLEMTKGKAAAQCCHAALAVYQNAQEKSTKTREWIKAWRKYGQAKITLKCPDEATMLAIQAEARILGLPAKSICDAGKTQIKAGSRTVLAIGPAPADLIDKVSGKCRLY
ncbi:peptidyl-tRNA hydrolase [Batrachochytrium salamandrivorans]|nr:hypothetical protein BASA62_009983 [Batrachochytrium salamandrivorans]KAH9246350.1 peptidyl-tRNA hydrolase [Batrachochytrium salamandrivorans]KAH9264956.1 peptidyl-tRNA hydrolase [Batrachochytrium salamandrivorans]